MRTMPPPLDPWLWSSVASAVASTSYAGADTLRALQARRLKDLVACAHRDSLLFRGLLRGVDLSQLNLRDLPVTRKRDLMDHFDEWVTDPAVKLDGLQRFTADSSRVAEPYLGRYMVWQSSGSTGEPGVFVQDNFAMAVYDALEAQRRPWPITRWLDPWYMAERIVFVGATGGHFASIVSTQRLRRLNPVLAANMKDISFLRPTDDVAANLHSLAPTIISTYPSEAMLLAEERLAGRLHVQPKEVWTGGETLTPAMRRFVQQAFDCPVIDSYGASEFLPLASECRCGRLHVNSDWAILESVDDRGRPVPDGELGETALLTNLANCLQPLIRYDLGDRIAVLAHPCECGSHLPALEVRGRHAEALRLGASGKEVSILPLALSTVLEDDAGLFDFQLVQLGPLELHLVIRADGEAARASLQRGRTALGEYLKRQALPDIRIACRSGQALQCGPGGKVQRVMTAPKAPARPTTGKK